MQPETSRDWSFYTERGPTGLLLLHGLGGTPVELRFVAIGLANAGFTVSCPQLAGHCGTVNELKASTWQDWYQSAEVALDSLRSRCDTVIVGGLSMGAVLALMLAAQRREAVDGATLFAPTLRLNGWGVPWYARLFRLVENKTLADCFNFSERHPYGVKDPRIRALVAAAIESGDSSQAGMLSIPGSAMLELRWLVDAVLTRASQIEQPVLLIHPREDDRADIANSFWLQRMLRGRVDTFVLDDSYHVITMDRQRQAVVSRTIDFTSGIANG